MSKRLHGDFRKFMDKSFLGSWDVPAGEDLILTIDHVARDEVKNERGGEMKMTLHFVEDYKPMVCNVTNGKAIAAAYHSNNVEDWEGKKVAIYTTKVTAFGGTTDALRIRDYPPKTDEYICADCGKVIKDFGKYKAKVIANRALTKYGRHLCYECAQIAGSEETEVSDGVQETE